MILFTVRVYSLTSIVEQANPFTRVQKINRNYRNSSVGPLRPYVLCLYFIKLGQRTKNAAAYERLGALRFMLCKIIPDSSQKQAERDLLEMLKGSEINFFAAGNIEISLDLNTLISLYFIVFLMLSSLGKQSKYLV